MTAAGLLPLFNLSYSVGQIHKYSVALYKALEAETGQSVGQVACMQLSPKLAWLDAAIATALGISAAKFDALAWLQSRQITVPEALAKNVQDVRWFGLLSLMVQTNSPDAVAV